jgi:hypothetical protein
MPQPRQMPGIMHVAFDSIPRRALQLRRRHHHTIDPPIRYWRSVPSDANVNAAAGGTDCPYSSRRGFRWRLREYHR